MYESITPEVLKQRVFDALTTDIDTREGSYTHDLIAPTILEVWKIYQALNGLIPIMYPDETSGAYIDKKCADYGITRKAGTKAVVTLTITGATRTTVPKGTVFLTAENLRFTTDAAATLTDGSVQVAATAAEVGSVYNVGTGAIIRQLSSISGVTAVTNTNAAQGGADAETDAALLARLYERLQNPATSGNADHYKQWALSVDGVGAAKVLPLADGPGTVTVLIASAGMGPVGSAIVQACADYIETVRPIGAAVTVETVEGLEIAVSAMVSIDSSTTVAAVQAARDDFALQLDVSTATWGLALWENLYGIAPDVSKSDTYRRTRIISKMRGVGTTTAAMIQNVAESFSNGEVEIIETPAEYRFDVKFVGTLGIPPNMDDLTAAIEQIKPAHLAYAFIYTYMVWDVLDAQAITFDQLDALSLSWDIFKRGEWIG